MARLGYPTDVDELLDDPWDCKSGEPPPKGPRRVSSLTLHEFAANCPYGEDPDDAGMRNNLARAPFGVHNLVDMCQSMTEWSGRVFYDETPTSAWQDIMELWRKAGIAQIASGNFFAVSIAATRRECKWSEDRIYGIQQLFQLRLGNTAVGKAGQQFTQDQLQDTLTITLLKTHSALSQIHVLTAPVAPGHAWKMNESSVFPRMTPERVFRIWSSKETLGGATGSSRALNMRRKENEREDSYIRSKGYTDRLTEYSCQFDVINIAGTTWARFKGYTTPFSRFIPRCYEEARSLPEDVLEVRRATTGLPP